MSRKISRSLVSGRYGAGTQGQGLKIEWGSTEPGRLHWMDVNENSLESVWYGSRGVIGGGAASEKDRMQYITIQTTGNATDFGNLVSGRENVGGLSNGSRGVFAGGEYNLTMEYITISTTSNTTDFGDLTSAFGNPSYNVEGCCNGLRGIFQGGHQSNSGDVLAYITVATTGNATAFGALSVDRYYPGSLADSTRAVFGGGNTGSASNVIDYVAFDTTGNATDFGRLS